MSDDRRMTFIVIPHGQKQDLSTRSYEISYRKLRTVGIAAGVAAGLVLLMALSWVWIAAQAARVPGLNTEIRRLQGEVAQVEQLRRTLARMEARYEQINRMLGGDVRVDTSGRGGAAAPEADADSADAEGEPADSARAAAPAAWPLLARGFVTRGHLAVRKHPGLDIAAAAGSRIVAAGAGTVLEAGEDSVYGRFVRIGHGDGYETLYGHASRVLVAPRERVGARQVIALVGSSGVSTAPHLHFEIRKDGSPVDPAALVRTPE